MEAIKHHQGNLKRFNISLSLFLTKAIKLLVSVSIFSIVFSSSFFSSYAKEILAHNIDKSYMFLLCNGILVFIVKNSARLIDESPRQESYDDPLEKKSMKKRHNQLEVVVKKLPEEISTRPSLIVSKEVDQETQEEEENEVLIISSSAAEKEGDDDDEQEDGTGLLSVEELNKKCEDFIRKMKKEIKFGSQQLIMV
ncbi:hypothetical protein ACOSP7_002910 [Xanthoceras sorbifolium]